MSDLDKFLKMMEAVYTASYEYNPEGFLWANKKCFYKIPCWISYSSKNDAPEINFYFDENENFVGCGN